MNLKKSISDFIFSDNYIKYVLLLMIPGFILRFLAAKNLSPNADEMVFATQAIDIIKSGVLQLHYQSPVWSYLTDIGYRLFGVSVVTARLSSLIFGTLSILLIYILAKELFHRKAGLIASILLTFSPFHILMTLGEHDITLTFFAMLTIYFLVLFARHKKYNSLLLSTISFAIAILIKPVALLGVPAYILLFLHIVLKNRLTTKPYLIRYALTLIILIIMISPILVYNLLLFQDKGKVDIQFFRFLDIDVPEFHSFAETAKGFSLNNLLDFGLKQATSFYYLLDPIIFVLGILGIIISFKKNTEWTLFLLVYFFTHFIFLAGTAILQWHFIFGVPVLILFSSNLLDSIYHKIKIKKLYFLIIILLVIINLYLVNSNSFMFDGNKAIFDGDSPVTSLIKLKEDSLNTNYLVLVDSRIYRGRTAFIFNDRHYLEAGNFVQLMQQFPITENNSIKAQTYYIECLIDDCGWGTIGLQPELNQTEEQIASLIKRGATEIATIKDHSNRNYFGVYETKLVVTQDLINMVDSTHYWFLYPVRFFSDNYYDNYKTNTFLSKVLDKLAYFFLWSDIMLALLSILLLIALTYKEYKKEITKK